MASFQERLEYRGGLGLIMDSNLKHTLILNKNAGSQRAGGQSSGTVTPTDTRESSEMRDTESEVSTGISEIIGNLQSLRREIEEDTTTDTSSTEGGGAGPGRPPQGGADVGRTSETGEIRRRTGNL